MWQEAKRCGAAKMLLKSGTRILCSVAGVLCFRRFRNFGLKIEAVALVSPINPLKVAKISKNYTSGSTAERRSRSYAQPIEARDSRHRFSEAVFNQTNRTSHRYITSLCKEAACSRGSVYHETERANNSPVICLVVPINSVKPWTTSVDTAP